MKNVKLFAIVPFLLFVAIAVFLYRGLQQDPRRMPSMLINKVVPEFSLPLLLQHGAVTQNIFKNKITVFSVWASWCISCRADEDTLLEMAKDRRIQLIGLDYKDDKSDALRFLKQFGNPFSKTVVDRKGDLAIDLGVYGTPETFIIDRRGRVRYKYVGPISPEVWRETLKPIIDILVLERQ